MDYVREIEEFLVGKRNKGLMISHRDWLIIEKWEALGIPVKIVKEGIEDTLSGLNFSCKGELHTVPTLTYCEKKVLTYWKGFKENLVGRSENTESGSGDKPFNKKAIAYTKNLRRRLEEDIKTLEEKDNSIANELKLEIFTELEGLEEKISDGRIKETRELEEQLENMDNRILNKLKEIIDDKSFQSLEEECKKRLIAYRSKMEESDYSEALEAMIDSRLRRKYGLMYLMEENFL